MALIEVKNVCKNFTMGQEVIHALNNVSLQIQQDDFSSIIGKSGSGKTTLMNIIGLLDQPTSGEYILNGTPVANLNDNERSRIRNKSIGFVFQNFNLLPRSSALKNVEMPLIYGQEYSKNQRREMAMEALTKVNLQNRVHHRPNELSGGQRQRVAIARALVNRPKIILADEPTGSLDSKTGHEILKLFAELNKGGVCVILVTHDSQVAERTQHIYTMIDGRLHVST